MTTGESEFVQKVRRALRSPTLVYTALAAMSRASFLILGPFLTRRMSTEAYGDLAFYQSVCGSVGVLFSLALFAAATRFYFDGARPQDSLARSGSVARWVILWVLLCGGLATLLVGFAPFGGDTRHHVRMVLLSAAGTSLGAIPLALAKAKQSRLFVAIFSSLDLTATILGTVMLVGVFDRGLNGALEALGITGILIGTVSVVAVLKTLPGRLDVGVLREAAAFSFPLIPHLIANQVLAIGDRWFLKGHGLEAQLGPYALASQLASPIPLVVAAHNETVSAQLGEEVRRGGEEQVRLGFRRSVRGFLTLSLVLALLCLAATPIVPVIFSERFAAATAFLPLILVSLLAEAVYYPATNALFYCNATSRIPLLTVVSGVISVGLNVLLIPRHGPWGAIASRLIATTARSALALVLAQRVMSAQRPEIK